MPQQFSPRRRQLLQGSGALAAGGMASILGGLQVRNAMAATGGKQLLTAESPYGALAPVNDLSTGLPLLQLPAGFSYRSYGWSGDAMDDGRPTPNAHDGMAVVGARRVGRSSELLLVRNHERGLVATPAEAIAAPHVYADKPVKGIITAFYAGLPIRIGASGVVTNPAAPAPTPFSGYVAGGTSTLLMRDNQWVGARGSLGGTLGNCAGGPTPWGSWLSCEETIYDFSAIGGRKHGYVFEVHSEPAHTSAEPIVGMGRFVHEAVAVDPASGHVYLTEDNRNISALYRYLPQDSSGQPGSLHRGGRLQAARIRALLRKAVPATLAQANDVGLLDPQIGDEYELEWVDIADPDADPVVVVGQPGGVSLGFAAGPTHQALSQGCARMSRGEGIWHAAGKLYIVDTAAGVDRNNRPGQGEGAVWELSLATMRLRAIFVSGDASVGNNPDNVTVSPRGGILLCEDGGASADGYGSGSRLLGLSPAGAAYIFCKNHLLLEAGPLQAAGKQVAAGSYLDSEFCGACFDPSGRLLFVNLQRPGLTVAIAGPWMRGNL